MNLYEINQQIMEAFEAAVDLDTGEIVNEQAFDALNELQMQLDGKIENILLWIKNLSAEAEALKKEKQAFADRLSRAEKKAESLKRYVAGILNGEKFSTERVSVTWRKSEVAEYIGDLSSLPEEYLRRKEPEIDKTALKKVLKAGEVIEGASLVTRNNMQIK